MVSENEIAELELLTSHCWPARDIVSYKGWVIQWNEGITWRANSVLPNSWESTASVESVVDYVIELYKEKNTAPTFKMTTASQPRGLDELLEEKRFAKRMVTHVQTIAIQELSCLDPHLPVDLFKANSDSLNALMHQSEREKKEIEGRKEIISRIAGSKTVARVMMHGRIAGVGLGVVEEDWLGLFSIRTLPEFRRQGVAWSISCALAKWGEDLGAERAFLQVEADNAPALNLYEAMGFQTFYTYWYRILES